MSGNEIIGKEELNSIKEIFNKSNGVLFAHGFKKLKIYSSMKSSSIIKKIIKNN